MIRNLKLTAFGRFPDESFDFGKATLFHGENEAGKTTLHDALLHALCNPSGTTKLGKRLNRRYGASRDASAQFDGDVWKFDAEEFVNLHAVEAGNLRIELKGDAKWMDRVKASLFSGGIDPEILRTNLNKRASTRGNFKHNQDLIRDEEALLKAEAELAGMEARRSEALKKESRCGSLRDRAGQAEKEARQLGVQVDDLKKTLDLEADIARRKVLDETLTLIRSRTDALEDMKGLSRVEKDEMGVIERLEKAAEESRLASQLSRDAHRRATEDLEESKRTSADVGAELRAQESRSEATKGLREQIVNYRESPPTTQRIRWRRIHLVVAGAGLFVATVGSAFLGGSSTIPYGLLVGLAWAAIWILLARKVSLAVSESAQNDVLPKLFDQWRQVNRKWAGTTLEALEEDLIKAISEHKSFSDQFLTEQSRIERLTAHVDDAKKKVELAEEEATDAADALRSWLCDRGVENRDSYVRSRSRLFELEKRVERCDRQLEPRFEEHECESIDDLQRDCERKLRDLDERGIPKKGRSELEVQALENSRAEVEGRVNELRKQRTTDLQDISGIEGEVRIELGNLPEEITRTERRISSLKRKIDRNRLEREAAAIAVGIFDELMGESDAVLEELSGEIGKNLQRIAGANRATRIGGLDGDSISVTDAGGRDRDLSNVSSGTQDAFMLAARLALAGRAVEGESLMIFDEPFQGFDTPRLKRAVDMLKDFQVSTGWQIVFLTKDDVLVQAVREAFGNDELVEHRLPPVGASSPPPAAGANRFFRAEKVGEP